MLTMESMKRIVKTCGFSPSDGSWEDERQICAFSVETAGPATYSASQFCIMFDRENNRLTGFRPRYRERVPFALGRMGLIVDARGIVSQK